VTLVSQQEATGVVLRKLETNNFQYVTERIIRNVTNNRKSIQRIDTIFSNLCYNISRQECFIPIFIVLDNTV
jgi:hypothetical protein